MGLVKADCWRRATIVDGECRRQRRRATPLNSTAVVFTPTSRRVSSNWPHRGAQFVRRARRSSTTTIIRGRLDFIMKLVGIEAGESISVTSRATAHQAAARASPLAAVRRCGACSRRRFWSCRRSAGRRLASLDHHTTTSPATAAAFLPYTWQIERPIVDDERQMFALVALRRHHDVDGDDDARMIA